MFTRPMRLLFLASVAVAAGLVLGACAGGGSEGGPPAAESRQASTTTAGEVSTTTTTTVDEAAVQAFLESLAPPETTTTTAPSCGPYCPNDKGWPPPGTMSVGVGEVVDQGSWGGAPAPPTGPPSAICEPSGWCTDQNGVRIPPGGVVTTTTPTTTPPGTVVPGY